MKKFLLTVIIFALAFMPFSVCAEKLESNVVIPEMDVVCHVSEGKSGSGVDRIKTSVSAKYRANRAKATVRAMMFYGGSENIDKAKVNVRGVRPQYLNSVDNNIFHDDSKVCVLEFPLEQVGKDVSVEFESTDKKPDFGEIYVVGEDYPITKFSITYHIPATLRDKVRVFARNIPKGKELTRTVSKDGKEIIYRLSLDSVPALMTEASAPSVREYLPCLYLAVSENVDELYTTLRSFTLNQDPDPGIVEKFAKELTADCADDDCRIRKIADWVRTSIRYIAIEHGDLGHSPAAASEVYRNLYGDCKGSAALLKAMFKAVGLDARLVWIGTDRLPEDFTDIPSGVCGNHMIAAVVKGDSILYVDGTVGIQDIGYYSPSIQGKQTLVENGDKPVVGRVPVLPPSASIDSIGCEFVIRDKDLVGTITESCTGSFKDILLNSMRNNSYENGQKVLKDYLIDEKNSCLVTDFSLRDDSNDKACAVITGKIIDKGRVAISGKKQYVDPDLFQLVNDRIKICDDRELPIKLKELRTYIRNVVLTVPDGMTVEKLPKDLIMDNEFFKAEISYRQSGDKVECKLVHFNKTRRIPLESVKEYQKELKKLARSLKQRIVLTFDVEPAQK